MAPSMKLRSGKEYFPSVPEKPFPFMSLPPELRLMIYDILIREKTEVSDRWCVPADLVVLSDHDNTLSCRVKTLLKVKDIRSELFHQLLSRYQFEWAGSGCLDTNRRWLSFKRYVLPFINNITLSIHDAYRPHRGYNDLFSTTLTWMRWRSQRSHLYPWQLKSLTVQEASRERPGPLWGLAPWIIWEMDVTEPDVVRFLKGAPMVPGLDSLKIVLKNEPRPEAAKAFLERCVRCGVEGKLGLWQCDRRMVAHWFHLEEGQIIKTTV